MRTVQILGTAPNVSECWPTTGERWCSGPPRAMQRKFKLALTTWTRWFNMHSRRHMLEAYPLGYAWYAKQTKPIYLQEVQADIPASKKFPREAILNFFGPSILGPTGQPYFTFSGSWFLALAIMEGFERIELHGFMLQRDRQYDFERPCFFYWINEARRRGIDVYIPPEVEITEPGDPLTYVGPIYGYETS